MTFLTIGQSPRDDLVPELVQIVGKRFEVHEIGLLDTIEERDIPKPMSERDLLVSRLRDGREVELSEEWVREQLLAFEVKEPTMLLCTSEFGIARYIEPYRVIKSFLSSQGPFESLAVVVPEKRQASLAQRWKGLSTRLEIFSFSPYEGIPSIPSGLADSKYIYLDCMGYRLDHESMIHEVASGTVISARRIVGKFLRTIV
ncbi:MAG: AroM protein [Mesotoga prima]|uniref:AroM protein n=1 Tax=Mesotoga prima TaxID=1184387 RepID=A0A101HKJ0_9BACT|nr:MAG: AroM protein [Mesotoga prima]